MTTSDKHINPKRLENAHYIGILESCLAMVCMSNGVNPETLMSKVLKDLTAQANMETEETDRLIENRWRKRTFARLKEVHGVASSAIKRSLENDLDVTAGQVAMTPKPWRERMRESAMRSAQKSENTETDTVTDTVSPTVK